MAGVLRGCKEDLSEHSRTWNGGSRILIFEEGGIDQTDIEKRGTPFPTSLLCEMIVSLPTLALLSACCLALGRLLGGLTLGGLLGRLSFSRLLGRLPLCSLFLGGLLRRLALGSSLFLGGFLRRLALGSSLLLGGFLRRLALGSSLLLGGFLRRLALCSLLGWLSFSRLLGRLTLCSLLRRLALGSLLGRFSLCSGFSFCGLLLCSHGSMLFEFALNGVSLFRCQSTIRE